MGNESLAPLYDEQEKLHYYTLKQALSLKPKEYELWVYDPHTNKVGEVRVVSNRKLNNLLTKCVWWIPYVFWPPIIFYILYPMTMTKFLYLSLGLVIWFPIEYLAHRFLFHMNVTNKVNQFAHLILHGVHHLAPFDLNHLVAPPLELGIQAVFIYAVLSLLHVPYPEIICAGLLIHYLKYDLFHYSVHAFSVEQMKRFPVIGNYMVRCKQNHMYHHFKDPKTRFTISYVLPWQE